MRGPAAASTHLDGEPRAGNGPLRGAPSPPPCRAAVAGSSTTCGSRDRRGGTPAVEQASSRGRVCVASSSRSRDERRAVVDAVGVGGKRDPAQVPRPMTSHRRSHSFWLLPPRSGARRASSRPDTARSSGWRSRSAPVRAGAPDSAVSQIESAERASRTATCRSTGPRRCARATSALRMPTGRAARPRSATGMPHLTGGRPGLAGDAHHARSTPWAIRSKPAAARHGPVCPKPEIDGIDRGAG